MKLNNKGFAITGILYGLLILFALLVGSYLTVLTARKNRLDGIVENIENEYNNKKNTTSTYTLTLTKDEGVSTIYYKINGASSFSSSTSNITLSVEYGTEYYYYGTSSTGHTMDSCTESIPCHKTMGTSAVTVNLTTSKVTPTTYTVTIMKSLDGAAATVVKEIYVSSGGTGSAVITGGAWYTFDSVSCTNRQSASITESYYGTSQVDGNFTIKNVTSNTVCTVYISS